jgi:hypothetical protein
MHRYNTTTLPAQHAATRLQLNHFIEISFQFCGLLLKFKKMNSKNSIPDLSRYRLSLVDFLLESHPERLSDDRFITARAEAAAQTCAQAVLNGSNDVQADEQARSVLFQGLHFSKHDTLVNILWNEFAGEVPEDEAKAFAIRLLPQLEPVFVKYPLSDDFACEPEYELLYTELTGATALYIEDHGIQ